MTSSSGTHVQLCLEQVYAAKLGNIDHVIALLRDVGRLHHLWQVYLPALECPAKAPAKAAYLSSVSDTLPAAKRSASSRN